MTASGRAFMVMDLAMGGPLLAGLSGVGAVAALPRWPADCPMRWRRHGAACTASTRHRCALASRQRWRRRPGMET